MLWGANGYNLSENQFDAVCPRFLTLYICMYVHDSIVYYREKLGLRKRPITGKVARQIMKRF